MSVHHNILLAYYFYTFPSVCPYQSSWGTDVQMELILLDERQQVDTTFIISLLRIP